MIYEDFVPLDDGYALVSRGEVLTSLTEIARVSYALDGDRVVLIGGSELLASGKHLRLGNMQGGVLCYSDCAKGIIGSRAISRTGIQPFLAEDGACYWNEPFAHGDCEQGHPQGIYRNGERILKYWEEGGVVGKPCVTGKWIYFEARTPNAKMPHGWEVWRMNLETEEREFICIGANPHPFDGKLFYTDFSMYPEDFDTYWIDHAL